MFRLAPAFAALILSSCAAGAAGPDTLWHIVNGQCVPHQLQFGSPLPCVAVNQPVGYAILRDINGFTQLLLIPTARVTGIEDPAIVAAGAPNYWQAAWAATRGVQALANNALKREDLSLAINSTIGRTQNQLHIHIDCLQPVVVAALRVHGAAIGTTWGPFPVPLAGHEYRAMRIETLQQPGADPFRVLAATHADMARESLVVVGATFPDGQPGFYLLETRAEPGRGLIGSGEELQDHTCTLAHHLPMQN